MRAPINGAAHGWEDNEFPILCETCLGDNPYVRMTREEYGSACHVCERPNTKFRWKAGTNGRHKLTVVCAACAKAKGVCQCCILDLTYGVPVEVRDRIVQKHLAAQLGIGALADGSGRQELQLPGSITAPLLGYSAGSGTAVSDHNRAYALARAEDAEKKGAVVPYSGLAAIAPGAHEELMRMGKHKPQYERNAQRICSFFVRGECNRGTLCPYRHEMPKEGDEGMKRQDYKSR
jgi:pre-mRNA-splicing factor RBM22/SLT11